MANRNKDEIAKAVRKQLISKHNYKEDGDYVRKEISGDFGIGFFHNEKYTLCICIFHKQKKSKIMIILSRGEFKSCYPKLNDGEDEIWASLNINAFDGYNDEEVAEWIVKLFCHFITTAELLEFDKEE